MSRFSSFRCLQLDSIFDSSRTILYDNLLSRFQDQTQRDSIMLELVSNCLNVDAKCLSSARTGQVLQKVPVVFYLLQVVVVLIMRFTLEIEMFLIVFKIHNLCREVSQNMKTIMCWSIGSLGAAIMNLIKLQMKDKNFVQMQTAVNSPTRRSFEKYQGSPTVSQLHLFTTQPSTERMSQTQQEIYNHKVIRELMEARSKNSVRHDINRIDKETALFAKPIQMQSKEFKFNSIPAENKMYSSQCHAKINQIKEGLRESNSNVKMIKTGQQKKGDKSRPVSAAAKVDFCNPKISVSGLVSYNFKTVSGGKSLGFNKINHEQMLIGNLMAASKRQHCSIQRRDRIMGKSSGARFLKYKHNQQAILKDFTNDTESYLADVLREEQQNTLIYNQRAKKLNFIKEYMQQQGVDYEEAAEIVTEIEGHQKKKAPKSEAKKKGDPNDEALLEGRRMPLQRKPLTMRHFSFIE